MASDQGQDRKNVGLLPHLQQTLCVGNSVDVDKYGDSHVLYGTDEYVAQLSLGRDAVHSILVDEQLAPLRLVCKTCASLLFS